MSGSPINSKDRVGTTIFNTDNKSIDFRNHLWLHKMVVGAEFESALYEF